MPKKKRKKSTKQKEPLMIAPFWNVITPPASIAIAMFFIILGSTFTFIYYTIENPPETVVKEEPAEQIIFIDPTRPAPPESRSLSSVRTTFTPSKAYLDVGSLVA